jgi:hypothetical protein
LGGGPICGRAIGGVIEGGAAQPKGSAEIAAAQQLPQ